MTVLTIMTVVLVGCGSSHGDQPPGDAANAATDADAPTDAPPGGSTVPIGPCDMLVGSGTTIVVGPGETYTTIQAGLDAAAPGDIVRVTAGTYRENVVVQHGGSAAAGCVQLEGDPMAIIDGTGLHGDGIELANVGYVRIRGLTVQNFSGTNTPIGISVSGASHDIEIRDNLVHDIASTSDAHGIAFYGDAAMPITNVLIDRNEIRNCTLGSSESMVLNGNVTNFVVSRNHIHDNDNIGIDFIGFEGVGPTGSDQAHDGICVDNLVERISSATNPAYNGSLAADGLYVDGGRDIVLERNTVRDCDIAIEVASEHQGKTTTNIVVRNNAAAGSYQGNLLIGGYAIDKGNAANISVFNNTFYGASDSEIIIQNNATAVSIKNNIVRATGNNPYITSGANNTNITVDRNLYFGASTSSSGAFADLTPLFADPQLNATSFSLGDGSPAIDAGSDLGSDANGPRSGLLDIDDSARVKGPSIDLGAEEHR